MQQYQYQQPPRIPPHLQQAAARLPVSARAPAPARHPQFRPPMPQQLQQRQQQGHVQPQPPSMPSTVASNSNNYLLSLARISLAVAAPFITYLRYSRSPFAQIVASMLLAGFLLFIAIPSFATGMAVSFARSGREQVLKDLQETLIATNSAWMLDEARRLSGPMSQALQVCMRLVLMAPKPPAILAHIPIPASLHPTVLLSNSVSKSLQLSHTTVVALIEWARWSVHILNKLSAGPPNRYDVSEGRITEIDPASEQDQQQQQQEGDQTPVVAH